MVVAAATATACAFPTDACACTPVPPPSAWLEGKVVNGVGEPVQGARVYVYATRDAEPPRVNYLYGQGSLTNSEGTFRTEVGGPGPSPVWLHATIIRSSTDTVRVRGGTVPLTTGRELRPLVQMTFQLP